jgi:hypothetical protein
VIGLAFTAFLFVSYSALLATSSPLWISYCFFNPNYVSHRLIRRPFCFFISRFAKLMDLAAILEVLILNPLACPPKICSYYGKSVARFTCSRLFFFGGKTWQLRSIKCSDQWRLFPFLVDTGGCAYNYPIISDPVLAYLGLDRAISAGSGDPKSVLEVPLPLITSPDPFRQNWDSPRALEIQSSGDLRFNMVGEGSANAINFIHTLIKAAPRSNADQILQVATRILEPLIEVTDEVKNCFLNEWKEMRRHMNSPDWDHAFDDNDLELKE